MGTPHTPQKFLIFSPQPARSFHWRGGMDIFWNHFVRHSLTSSRNKFSCSHFKKSGMDVQYSPICTVSLALSNYRIVPIETRHWRCKFCCQSNVPQCIAIISRFVKSALLYPITELRPLKNIDRRCKFFCQSNVPLCIAIISRRK